MFNIRMLELLVCPISHSDLHYDSERQLLISTDDQNEYPIINGIPIFIPDSAPENLP